MLSQGREVMKLTEDVTIGYNSEAIRRLKMFLKILAYIEFHENILFDILTVHREG